MLALMFAIQDDLTTLEVTALDYLARTIRPGFCPSREELSRAAGLGGRGYHISKILESLEEKQYLALAPGRSRAITLLRTADGRRFSLDTVWVPLVGQIVASEPLPTAEQLDNPYACEAIELTRELAGRHENVYALMVQGESMIDALVNNGDIIVLTPTSEVHNGDMVAARVTGDDGQAATTLKYFYRENGHVRLQPAHPGMLPFIYHPSQVAIQGKVLLVIRQVGSPPRRVQNVNVAH